MSEPMSRKYENHEQEEDQKMRTRNFLTAKIGETIQVQVEELWVHYVDGRQEELELEFGTRFTVTDHVLGQELDDDVGAVYQGAFYPGRGQVPAMYYQVNIHATGTGEVIGRALISPLDTRGGCEKVDWLDSEGQIIEQSRLALKRGQLDLLKDLLNVKRHERVMRKRRGRLQARAKRDEQNKVVPLKAAGGAE